MSNLEIEWFELAPNIAKLAINEVAAWRYTQVEIIKNAREKKLARTMNKGTIQTLPRDWHWELRLGVTRRV